MKILIVINHPTQFEGPFFRYVGKQEHNDFEVLFVDNKRMKRVFDPELKQEVSWGIDLLSGYNYSVLPSTNWRRWLYDKLKNENYDFIIVNGYYKPVFRYSLLFAKVLGIRSALRMDSVNFTQSKSAIFWKKFLFGFLNVICDHFFVVGSLTKDFALSVGVPIEKISLFSYVVDNDYFEANSHLTNEAKLELRTKYNILLTKKIIICVAKLNDRESPWDLIYALVEVNDPDLHLLLVGDGEDRTSIEHFAAENMGLNISFAGYVPYKDLAKHYGIADVFVHASKSEPWGVSVQEAMASGLPVIVSSRVGAGYDLIEKGQNGFIYNVGDKSQLAIQLKKVLYEFSKVNVDKCNRVILEEWSYSTAWRNILESAV